MKVVVLRWPVKEIRTHGKQRNVVRVKEPTARLECRAELVRGFLEVEFPGMAGFRRFSRARLVCLDSGMGDYILEASTLPEEARFPTKSTSLQKSE